MKVQQFIKKMNNTELGKTRMNDTYISIPQQVDVSELFEYPGDEIPCVDKKSGEIVKIRFTFGKEKRITGLGRYYKEKEICAGDEIIIEKQEMDDNVQYFIDTQIYKNIVIFNKMKQGFEVLTPERLSLISGTVCLKEDGIRKKVEVCFICREKKRGDSPEKTDFYDIKVDGNSLMENYSTKELLEIRIEDENTAQIKSFCSWRKYLFTSEE